MDGREGSQRSVDAKDCGLSLEQANVSWDVIHIVENYTPAPQDFHQAPHDVLLFWPRGHRLAHTILAGFQTEDD